MRYNCELKFVIPHFREVDNVVTEIDYEELRKKVFYELDLLGLNYYMMLPIKEVIDGVAYDADMVIVYCSEILQNVFSDAFEKVCRECSEEWGIDFFTYVQNGNLVTIEMQDNYLKGEK